MSSHLPTVSPPRPVHSDELDKKKLYIHSTRCKFRVHHKILFEYKFPENVKLNIGILYLLKEIHMFNYEFNDN